MDITVAIPTYNGALRLPEVLGNLQRQLKTEAVDWEILIIDNNSGDGTQEVIARYQTKMPHMRWCQETMQGAGFCRRRALREARGELVAFLDDDNIPDVHWVSAVAQFGHTHPQAGAYGSKIQADYAVPPPVNFSRIAPFLAISDLGSQPLLYKKCTRFLPPSAGLVVRKSVWKQCVPSEMILSGRIEGNPLTGEDLEMLGHIQASHWEIWYNPDMKITHKIPAARLEKEYLIPFLRGIGHSRHITRTMATKGIKRYLLTLAYLGNDLKKILLHLVKHRTQVKTDLVASCELEFLISCLTSPFFLWRNGYLNKSKSYTDAKSV
jgi:glycosyltransferase involved in cell wall biosynthesis